MASVAHGSKITKFPTKMPLQQMLASDLIKAFSFSAIPGYSSSSRAMP
jgi:hypothetical protein